MSGPVKTNTYFEVNKIVNWEEIQFEKRKDLVLKLLIIYPDQYQRYIEIVLNEKSEFKDVFEIVNINDFKKVFYTVLNSDEVDYVIELFDGDDCKANRKRKRNEEKVENEVHESYNADQVLNQVKQELESFVSGKMKKITFKPPAHMKCQLIRIGSYKCKPLKRVQFDVDEVKIFVQSIENDDLKCIRIKLNDITHLKLTMDKYSPVIYIYTNCNAVKKIRKTLCMYDPEGLYYDPDSPDIHQTRIILIPRTQIEHDLEQKLRNIFKHKFFHIKNCKKSPKKN